MLKGSQSKIMVDNMLVFLKVTDIFLRLIFFISEILTQMCYWLSLNTRGATTAQSKYQTIPNKVSGA